MKPKWEKLCPGFHNWFLTKRKYIFVRSVIESARKNSDMDGLYYNNNVECHYYREKLEQCFQTITSCGVIDTLSRLTERQQSDEVKALNGNGPYLRSTDCSGTRGHQKRDKNT